MSVKAIRTHLRELRLYTAAHELEDVLNAQLHVFLTSISLKIDE